MRPLPHRSRLQEQPNNPIFLDNSGRRRRVLWYIAVTMGFVCTGYLVLFAVVLGLQQSVEKAPPRMDEPLPGSAVRHESEAPVPEAPATGPTRRSGTPDPGSSPTSIPPAPPGDVGR